MPLALSLTLLLATPPAALRSTVDAYLSVIDTPITAAAWRALGAEAVPILEAIVTTPDELPSRRAAAVGALAVLGGTRARTLVLKTARTDGEPWAVRAAAIHGSALLLTDRELLSELGGLLDLAAPTAVRAVAADVLATRVPATACPVIAARAPTNIDERGVMARALERCGEAP